jgi:hypothetical protein
MRRRLHSILLAGLTSVLVSLSVGPALAADEPPAPATGAVPAYSSPVRAGSVGTVVVEQAPARPAYAPTCPLDNHAAPGEAFPNTPITNH